MTQATLIPEPTLSVCFLPRCSGCGGKHPQAYRPPLDRCPTCAARPEPPSATIDVPAVLTGRAPSTVLARALFALGRFFASLERSFR